MKKYTFIFFLSLSNFMFSQIITKNTQAVGLEHNMLFNANQRYTVTQTGTAKLNTAILFDGRFLPSYTATAPTTSSPTTILIEGLSAYHIQAGAWIGWSTRYWQAKRFKIEGYNQYNGANTWVTMADYSGTDYTGGTSFSTKVPSGGYSKLRFTFYSAYGTNGRLGVSELFFLHPEAMSPYQGLIDSHWYKDSEGIVSTKNHVNIGGDTNKTLRVRHINGKAGGTEFDNLYLNYNIAKNVWVGGTTKRSDLIVANAESRVGIGTTNPDAALMVNTKSSLMSRFQNGTPSDLVSGVRVNSKNSSGAIRYLDIAVDAENDKAGFGLGVSSGSLPIGKTNLDVAQIVIDRVGGKVGIGTANPDSKLAVNGTIHAKEVKVDLVGWPDYVFENRYNLPTLKEVEKHIEEKGHLQNIPSAKEVAKNGVELGEMNKKLLEKIEELTLYTIQQEKRIEKLETKNTQLENQQKKIEALEKKLNALLSKK